MAVQSKSAIASYFTSGDRPTETQFGHLVDSYLDYSELLSYIGTAISQQTGVLEIVSASATTHSVLPLNLGGTGEGSLSSAQDVLFAGETGLAQLSSANRFTNTNTFAATATNFISSATGSNEGPFLVLDKPNSQSDGDNLASILMKGADSGGNSSTYAKIRGQIVSTSASNENGRFQIITVVSGATAVRLNIGGGGYTTNASGADMGIDTWNVNTYYAGGNRVYTLQDIASFTLTASAQETSAIPASCVALEITLDNVSPDANNAQLLLEIGDSDTYPSSGQSVCLSFAQSNDTQTDRQLDGRLLVVGDANGSDTADWDSGNSISGIIHLRKDDTNHWFMDSKVNDITAAIVHIGSGWVDVSGAATHLRLSVSGAAFDSGRAIVRGYA